MLNNITLSEIFNKEYPFESLPRGTGIVLIGTALTGPARVPIKATDLEQVSIIFGLNSQLTNAYMEAVTCGATSDIYLIRVNGEHAQTNIQNKLILTSLDAIEEANDLQYEIFTSGDDRYLTLSNNKTGYYSSYYLTGKTISQLASEINIDAVTMQSPVYASVLVEGPTSMLIDEYPSEAQTEGAELGYPKLDYIREIEEILASLEDYPIAQIGILCEPFFAKSEDGHLYDKLQEFAQRKAKACAPCIITIGAEYLVTTDDFVDREVLVFERAVSFASLLQTECPVSEFINIVISGPRFPGFHPSYRSSGVAAYCGIIDGTSYYEGTTNKAMLTATSDVLSFTDEQRAKLAELGYVVTITGTYNGQQQVRIYRGVNLTKSTNAVIDPFAPREPVRYIPSPLTDIANVKLVQHIAYRLNDVLDFDELSQISTLRARLEDIMRSESEYIKNYNISISETYHGYTKTYVVNIEMVPAGEVDSLVMTIQTR